MSASDIDLFLESKSAHEFIPYRNCKLQFVFDVDPADFVDVPVSVLGFSVRSYNCLNKTGVVTLAELFGLTLGDVLSIPAAGIAVIKDILTCIRGYLGAASEFITRVDLMPESVRELALRPFLTAYFLQTKTRLETMEYLCDDSALCGEIIDWYDAELPKTMTKKRLLDEAAIFVDWLAVDAGSALRSAWVCSTSALEHNFVFYENVVRRRIGGETLETIGDAYGITRQRVLQVSDRWCSLFCAKYEALEKDPILWTYALKGGGGIVTADDLLDKKVCSTEDERDLLMFFLRWCDGFGKNRKNRRHIEFPYVYSEYAGFLIVNETSAEDFTSDDVDDRLSTAVSDMPRIMPAAMKTARIGDAARSYGLGPELVEVVYMRQCEHHGDFYAARNVRWREVVDYVLFHYFPNGVVISDKSDMEKFKEYCALIMLSEKMKDFSFRFICNCIYDCAAICGKSKYIHKDKFIVDAGVVNEVRKYIAASSEHKIYYEDIYDSLTDVFTGTNIGDRYCVQGLIQKYLPQVRTKRDYIMV